MKIKIDVSDNKNVFFISDFHLFHKNVIGFDNRPFLNKNNEPDVLLMNRTIIDNWNNTVNHNDIVFYLGDLIFGRKEWANQVIFALNGSIHYIMGNHDKYNDIVSYKRFESVNDYVDLNIVNDKEYINLHFVLMHYPIYSWNRAHHGSFMIHGHCHMKLSDGEFHKNKRIFDVGCNGWDYTPVSYKKIVELGNKIDYKVTTKHH
jgi:calcineurin-like phosphoesterase family protein